MHERAGDIEVVLVSVPRQRRICEQGVPVLGEADAGDGDRRWGRLPGGQGAATTEDTATNNEIVGRIFIRRR